MINIGHLKKIFTDIIYIIFCKQVKFIEKNIYFISEKTKFTFLFLHLLHMFFHEILVFSEHILTNVTVATISMSPVLRVHMVVEIVLCYERTIRVNIVAVVELRVTGFTIAA